MHNKLTEELAPTISIGGQFRQARESLNLTIDQVARQINLRPIILEYIENDQLAHKNIPPAFMKGYIRNYAKFLKLPEHLWSIKQGYFGEKITNDLSKNTRAKKASRSHSRWIAFITFIILFVVIGMTGYWWWENYQQSNIERDNLVQNYVVEEKQKLVETPIVESSFPILQENSTQNKIENSTTQNNEISEINPISENNPAQAILAQHQEQNLNSQNEPSNSSNQPSVAVEKGDLRIEIIQATSWITVKDANRKNLAQKEYKQGEILTFNEGAPYSLIIGAPSNVKITYKGEHYPLKVDGRVAKFKLQ